jgi:hypothetical protein
VASLSPIHGGGKTDSQTALKLWDVTSTSKDARTESALKHAPRNKFKTQFDATPNGFCRRTTLKFLPQAGGHEQPPAILLGSYSNGFQVLTSTPDGGMTSALVCPATMAPYVCTPCVDNPNEVFFAVMPTYDGSGLDSNSHVETAIVRRDMREPPPSCLPSDGANNSFSLPQSFTTDTQQLPDRHMDDRRG